VEKSTRIALWIIATAALTWFLEKTASVLIPFVFAVFLYYIVYPLVDWVKLKSKMPHFLSVIVTLLGFALIWTGIGLVVASSIRNVLKSADVYQERLGTFFQTSAVKLHDFGFDVDPNNINESLQKIPLFSWLSGLSGSLLSLLGYAGLVLVFLIFMLSGHAPQTHDILKDIQKKITRYVLIKTALSAGVAVTVTIVLASIGVEMAPLFGLLTYLLNFIPNIGSLIAIFLPLPIVILQSGFGTMFFLSALIPAGIHFFVGNILEAKWMGDSFDLHPVVVLFSLLFWGFVWGVIGMLLAVPLMAVLKVVFERFKSTQYLSELLSGRF
jgi:AI-2 transport protein TqsA